MNDNDIMYMYDENDLFAIADKIGITNVNEYLAAIKPYEIEQDKLMDNCIETGGIF